MIQFGFQKMKEQKEEKYHFPVITIKDDVNNTIVLNKAACDFMGYEKNELGLIAFGTVNGKYALINTTSAPINKSNVEFTIHRTTGNSFNSLKIKKKLISLFSITAFEIKCTPLEADLKCLLLDESIFDQELEDLAEEVNEVSNEVNLSQITEVSMGTDSINLEADPRAISNNDNAFVTNTTVDTLLSSTNMEGSSHLTSLQD